MSNTLETLIAGDVGKAIAAIPLITNAVQAGSASLSADQHADLVTKTTDLLAAVTPSVAAAANAGLLGQGDASHIEAAAAVVSTAASQVTVWEKIVSYFKSLF